MSMEHLILSPPLLKDGTIRDVLSRDSTLWLGSGFEDNPELSRLVATMALLPWSQVLCESCDPGFLDTCEELSKSTDFWVQARGHVHFIASDPRVLSLPPRSMPFFCLNGRSGTTSGPESDRLGRTAALRRRLNMLSWLEQMPPKRLFVLSFSKASVLPDIEELWSSGFEALMTFLSDDSGEKEPLKNWLATANSPAAVEFPTSTLLAVIDDLLRRTRELRSDSRVIVRYSTDGEQVTDIDLSSADLPEHPLLENYELIEAQHLTDLSPDELTSEDLSAFFSARHESWAPHAAGLPWPRGGRAVKSALERMHRLSSWSSQGEAWENQLVIVPAQSGAGATTFARSFGHGAARLGIPTLVSRRHAGPLEALPLAGFLFRCKQIINHSTQEDWEPTWLVVFDQHHWEGRETLLLPFLNELTRSGRRVICLLVTSDIVPEVLDSIPNVTRLPSLTHDISLDESLDLGRHLNFFLKPHGRDKSEEEWTSFWRRHSPTLDLPIASFWIALEFWLRGLVDLSTSIQSWLLKQFIDAPLSVDARQAILEVAALTIERRPLPEMLMGYRKIDGLPIGTRLGQIANDIPSLSLVFGRVNGRYVWLLAHDLLGRYLLNGVLRQRSMLVELGLAEVQDSIELRLVILGRIASRPEMAEVEFRELANQFAVQILKVDSEYGAEFLSRWRDLLRILEGTPKRLRENSRTFLHHTAISRRRVSTGDLFDLSDEERALQLGQAIEEIGYALSAIVRSDDDESDLNLYNSLALAYQNLAEVQAKRGAEVDEVSRLRALAHETTEKAIGLDPSNSYVLETAARNMLQQGGFEAETRVHSAAAALTFVFQAIALEGSHFRQHQLTSLANRAVSLLSAIKEQKGTDSFGLRGAPESLLSRVWMTLLDGVDELDAFDLSHLPPRNVESALRLIDETGSEANWLITKLQYDLVAARFPADFQQQVAVLDELVGTGFNMPAQMQLEYAILLYQVGRYRDGAEKFRMIRSLLKSSEAIVYVPSRLRWLYVGEGSGRRICEARYTEEGSGQSFARLRELGSTTAPFRAQEFGLRRLTVGAVFSCHVSFRAMGPFLRPPTEAH